MQLTVDHVMAAFSAASSSPAADFAITGDARTHRAHLAVSRRGFASLLIPVPHVEADSTRLTHGMAFSAAKSVEFARGNERWRSPAAVVECREPRLAHTFAALVVGLVGRLEEGRAPTWESVSSLLSEWERLLGRRRVMSGEEELGLWGELWCIARSSKARVLLDAWRGPEAERVDFFLEGLGIEVKVGRRQGVHLVSQAQVDEPLGEAPVVFLSMYAMLDPLRGRSLVDLVHDVSDAVDDRAAFEEKLAGVGYSRDDEVAYTKRYALLEPPLLYRREDVPRVRTADAGVYDLRYRVELARDAAMGADARSLVIDT